MALVVVGNGMVGSRLCELLSESGWARSHRILVYGEESLAAYDRIHLTDLFDSDKRSDELLLRPTDWYVQAGIELRTKECVVEIDRQERLVRTSGGACVAYEELVLATGSQPVLPPVPGLDCAHVQVYRSIEDREAIDRSAVPGARVAILGAGLLGIELAAVLVRRHCSVVLLERAPRVLPKHLEETAAALLAERLRQVGIDVRTNQELCCVESDAQGITLKVAGSDPLRAELLVVATGVRPRDELARAAGLICSRRGGIHVDDELRTSDPHIFALGECVVHRDVQYGLVAPGYAMAEVLAQRFGGGDVHFDPVPFSARLKVEGIELSMLGECDAGDVPTEALTAVRDDTYRRILLRDGRVIGATAVGPWPELSRVQESIGRGERLSARQRLRFKRSATLWRSSQTRPLSAWPENATVCSCTGVTCGALRRAHARGHTTPDALARATGASSVCGSCAPWLAELCGQRPIGVERSHGLLLAASLIGALLAAAVFLLEPISLPRTVQLDVPWDLFWRSSAARQTTGFAILAVALAGLALTPRKRWSRFSFGSYARWRNVHALLGAASIALVALHTGLHLGQNMNFALMSSFLALGVLGAVAGAITALERRLAPAWGGRLRRAWTLAHVLTLSPFSVLLGFHVLEVYYF